MDVIWHGSAILAIAVFSLGLLYFLLMLVGMVTGLKPKKSLSIIVDETKGEVRVTLLTTSGRGQPKTQCVATGQRDNLTFAEGIDPKLKEGIERMLPLVEFKGWDAAFKEADELGILNRLAGNSAAVGKLDNVSRR